MKNLLLSCLLAIALFTVAPLTLAARNKHTYHKQTHHLLTNIRTSGKSSSSRIVFDLSSNSSYKIFSLAKPDRLVVDINNFSLAKKFNIKKVSLKNTSIKALRYRQYRSKLRLVLDLKKAVTFNHFALKGKKGSGPRIVVDIKTKTENQTIDNIIAENNLTNSKSTPRTKPAPKPNSPITNFPKRVNTPPPSHGRDIIIVIDPGHGGKDPGATGHRYRTREKNVVLAISKYLQSDLNKEWGFRALLTRNNDHFITLRDRLHIAHMDHADMFVAIHADAYVNRYARGASVFALSQRGATSEAAHWLARKENESELGKAMEDKSNLLKSVLIDLAQTATINNSLQIGMVLSHQLRRIAKMHHYGVEQAAFVVLKSPDIPSLLVETGFLSNRTEEAKLRSSKYQKHIADALAQGMIKYFKAHPPRGTYLSSSVH